MLYKSIAWECYKVIHSVATTTSDADASGDPSFSVPGYTFSMPAIFEFNGVRLTVPASELGSTLLELRRIGLLPPLLNSGSASTSQDVSNETRDLVSPVKSAVGTTTTELKSEWPVEFAGRVPRKASDIKAAVSFLRMVSREGRAGPENALAVFHAKHAKGLGSKLAAVNRLLDSCNFAIPDVYTTSRDARGSFWKPAEKIEEAISLLAQKALEVEGQEQSVSRNQTAENAGSDLIDQILKEETVQPQHNEKSP